MTKSLLSLLSVIALCATTVLSAPAPKPWAKPGWTQQGHYPACTPANTKVRREFGSLSPPERKAYTDAIQCLIDSPSKLDPSTYPGAKNRFMDFAAIHISKTLNIHLSGFFFSWHRMYVQIFEQVLHDECGYQGTQPYWDWFKWAGDVHANPLFDGSPYSMGGDGAYVDEGAITIGPALTIPHGSGGGCVQSGPFSQMQTHFAPLPQSVITAGNGLPANTFDDVPICFQRDLNQYVASTWTQYANYTALLNAPDAATFEELMSGDPTSTALGTHAAGHFTIGKAGSDFFGSPQDPVWFSHHAMVDKVWSEWQAKSSDNQWALSGTQTCLNIPASNNVTLTDTINWDIFAGDYEIGDLMQINAGPFCYRYE